MDKRDVIEDLTDTEMSEAMLAEERVGVEGNSVGTVPMELIEAMGRSAAAE